ncbi:hypothetical protein COLO4_20701 [Corchorus olitorius]|uniref:Disease resistance R13L4/SHOC-2-like LRR domain-containing protein n=1 Tax=Corchorus olitorius TaxID=93759 RepID=A0A1R3IXI6_9ROSI|nr:hypothetical protein COLO4_20701 [Corchorus olitorius]
MILQLLNWQVWVVRSTLHCLLKYLSYLDLSLNHFNYTPIPKLIGSLTELTYLNLSSSYFVGLVPHQLGNLSNLQYLDLYSSTSEIWVSNLNWVARLSSLKYLNLGYANLSLASTSWLSVINMLPHLEELHLPGCELDQVPYSLPFVNFSSIQVLDIQENLFKYSSLPQWFFNISSSLVVLNLRHSGIGGYSLNDVDWGYFCHLQTLDLSYTEITGEFDKFVSSLSKCGSNVSLEVLHLWYNHLGGQIPESLGHLKNLKSLDLADNPITGSIPVSIGNLSCLKKLQIGSNKLGGTIPESLGQLKELIHLSLEGNWNGVISETHFLHLQNLKILGLFSWNKSLEFDIGQDWIPPFSLEVIDIRYCQIGPNFPQWLKTQTELQCLLVQEVAISDTMPDWFWERTPQLQFLVLYSNGLRGRLPESLEFAPSAFVDLSSNLFEGSLPLCSRVRVLLLRNNSFSGPIPKNIGVKMLLTLKYLDLSKNFLNGTIPSSMTKLKNLRGMSLSNNLFSGNIPMWKPLANLRILDFSKNNLSGGIPRSICSHPSLEILKLSGNNLSGTLSSLQNCKGRLTELGLADNLFHGGIPKWIGERLSNLSILSLGGNMFSGNIPENLCHLSNLHILELRHNNLSGQIPTCLGNLSRLSHMVPYSPTYLGHPNYWNEMEFIVKGEILEFTLTLGLVNIIDLSKNNLHGEIPKEVTNLSTLGTLNLSWNNLTGNIPEKIGNLRSLETLDLSGNHLSGTIPSSMSDITALSHLNLSYNNLSGPIPSTNQFQTFNDPSVYKGNPKLYGCPLPTNCSTFKSHQHESQGSEVKDEDVGDDKMLWFYFYLGMAPGFVVGFWIVCGSLIFNKSWRRTYFGFVDEMKNRICVTWAMTWAHLLKKLKATRMET